MCGDGACNGTETCATCPRDCGVCPPVSAANDEYWVSAGTTLAVAAPGVLGNDTVAAGLPAPEAALVSGPAHGALTFNADGSFVYAASNGWHGEDSFSYQAVSATNVSLVATVAVTVVALARESDPVVLVGSNLTALIGVPVARVAGFRWTNGWEQVPVQVDQRKPVDMAEPYNLLIPYQLTGITNVAYADTNTYTGGPTTTNFDADDELVFMAKDTGMKALPTATLPAHVVAGTGLELTVSDPNAGTKGYVYLWRSDGTLSPGAGRKYVNYTFNLLSGSYKPHYQINTGPNAESSVVSNGVWRTKFRDTWRNEELNIYADGASGVDILDRHRLGFSSEPPSDCFLNETNLCATRRTFYANKDGPVRGIRSYMGMGNANGYTERDHFFYERRQDVVTYWRSATRLAFLDVYDYSLAAVGMTYRCNLRTVGVPVDGVADTIECGRPRWEMVSGAQGTVIVAHRVDTDVPGFTYRNYYADREWYAQCAGDSYEIACSGLYVTNQTPNLSPQTNPTNHLTFTRVVYYEGPRQGLATAQARWVQANSPLLASAAGYVPGDTDGDGLPDAWEQAVFAGLSHTGVEDYDGDGCSNWAEYVAGTDAKAATNRLVLQVARAADEVVVWFVALEATGAGYDGLKRFYALERRGALESGGWAAVAGCEKVAGAGQTVMVPAAEGEQGFYRLKVWLGP